MWNVPLHLGKGVSRQVLAFSEELMLVKVRFEKGAIGERHQHRHVQSSYVSEGKFSYTIGDQEFILEKGDSCVIPSNTQHGCVCLESGELMDSFTPARADFI
jgi:quercetin dioxygenase-like cupin family protein